LHAKRVQEGRKQWTCLAKRKALLVACLVARGGGWRGWEEDSCSRRGRLVIVKEVITTLLCWCYWSWNYCWRRCCVKVKRCWWKRSQCCYDEEIMAWMRGCWSYGGVGVGVVVTAEREREVGAGLWFLATTFWNGCLCVMFWASVALG